MKHPDTEIVRLNRIIHRTKVTCAPRFSWVAMLRPTLKSGNENVKEKTRASRRDAGLGIGGQEIGRGLTRLYGALSLHN